MQYRDKVVSPQELAVQQDFCSQVYTLYQNRLGRQPLACTVTFGCQQNEADTELIRGMLTDMGFAFTDNTDEADLVIFNTCAIREHAEMRVFGNVGEMSHLKKTNPNLTICVCGCMAQQQHIADKIKNSYPYVDLLFGTHALYRFPQLLHQRLVTKKRIFDLSGDNEGIIIEGVQPIRKAPPTAWLSIMYGCNNFCSYCIVPYVRGRERSRKPEVIVREFEQLVQQGYKDITLLGQNVNSYGKDLEEACDFASLLKQVQQIPGDFRVRFMTSHPKDATPRLFDTMARCSKVCNSIHLPVQCGSDRVLQEMNRRYDTAKYLSLVEYARSVMPDLTITSDIIVGFPGETEEDFQGTLDLLEKVRFDSLFTFIYSRRAGTKAATMPDPATREEKQDRFDRLLAVQNRICREINDTYVGRTMRVLIDGESEDKEYTLSARTEGFKLVHVKGDKDRIGTWANVRIEKRSTWALFGRVEE